MGQEMLPNGWFVGGTHSKQLGDVKGVVKLEELMSCPLPDDSNRTCHGIVFQARPHGVHQPYIACTMAAHMGTDMAAR